MPQLDSTFFASQLFWLTVSLIALYCALHFYALPRLKQILLNRANRFKQDRQAAEHMRDEANKLMADYEKAIATQRDEAQNVIAQLHEDLKHELAQKEEELQMMLAREAKQAQEHLHQLQDEANQHIKKGAMLAAEEIIFRVLGSQRTKEKLAQLTQYVEEELKIHQRGKDYV